MLALVQGIFIEYTTTVGILCLTVIVLVLLTENKQTIQTLEFKTGPNRASVYMSTVNDQYQTQVKLVKTSYFVLLVLI